MNRNHRLASLAGPSLCVAELERLLHRALCRGDGDDADRAAIELYLVLLEEMERGAPGDEDAPCLVATLMFAMARRFLAGPASPPAAAATVAAFPAFAAFRPVHLAA
jgi:hypothetical protein